MNLDERIRQSIERHTADGGGTDAVPEGLLGRARRRVALTLAVGTFAVAAIAGGGYALVSSLIGRDDPKPNVSPSVNPTPSREASVRSFVSEFMQRRLHPSPGLAAPTARDMLSARAIEQYDAHRGELFLHVPTLDVTWTDFEIQSVEDVDTGFRVRVRLTVAAAPSAPPVSNVGGYFVDEVLMVGEGRAESGEHRDLLIQSATGMPYDATQTLPSGDEPFWLVHHFLVARIAGEGAEPYMSSSAIADFQPAGSGLDLYPRGDSPIDLGNALVSSIGPSEDGYEVVVRLTKFYPGDSTPCPHTEVLHVRPSGEGGTFQVTDASVRHAGWHVGRLDTQAAAELACAFVLARLAGTAAESFLGPDARGAYEAGEGGLRLYPPENSHWGFWWLMSTEPSGNGVRVVLTLNNTGQPEAIYEELLIERPDAGSTEAFVVSARILTCEEANGGAQFCP